MSLSEFHQDHAQEIVMNDNKRYAAIAILVFGAVMFLISFSTYLVFLIPAFAALVYGALSFDATRKKAKHLKQVANAEQDEVLDEAFSNKARK